VRTSVVGICSVCALRYSLFQVLAIGDSLARLVLMSELRHD
jgi:hypothetical protein